MKKPPTDRSSRSPSDAVLQSGRSATRKRVLLRVLLPLALILALLAGLFLLRPDWWPFSQRSTVNMPALPGIMPADSPMVNHTGRAEQIEKQLSSKVTVRATKAGDTKAAGDLLVSWYQTAPATGGGEPVQAGTAAAADQLLLAQVLIEQNQRSAFHQWLKTFSQLFVTDQGVVASLTQEGDVWHPGEVNWPATLQTVRVLLQAEQRWPAVQSRELLAALSDVLWPLFHEQLPGETPRGIADTENPLVSSDLTPTPIPGASSRFVRLSDLDLWTLKALAAQDARWSGIYEKYLGQVREGKLTGNLPLYSLGIWEKGGYLAFGGNQQQTPLPDALRVLLHLAECEAADPLASAWLKRELTERGQLYNSYHVATGLPGGEPATPDVYALAARLGRATGDQALYDLAVQGMDWWLATSATSPIRGAYYRPDDSAFRLFASDNLRAILVFR